MDESEWEILSVLNHTPRSTTCALIMIKISFSKPLQFSNLIYNQ